MEYFSFNSSKFSQLNEPPMAHISASIGRYIFLIGGYQTSYENDTRTIIVFDKHTVLYYNVWTSQLDTLECTYDNESIGSFPPEYFCASGMASCSNDNRIYLFGGYSLSKQEACNALYYIEINSDLFVQRRNYLDMKVVSITKPESRLVFLAGSHDELHDEDCHSHFPSYRDKASLVFWRKSLVVFGGYGLNFVRNNGSLDHEDESSGHNFMGHYGEYVSGSDNRGWNNQLLMFSLKTNRWTNPPTSGSVPAPRAAHCAVVTEDRMLVFGGRLGLRYTSATVRSNHLYCLDLTILQWTQITLVMGPESTDLIGRSWTTMSLLDNRSVFILGGFSGDNLPLSDAFLVRVNDNWRDAVVVKKQQCFQRAAWDPYMDDSVWNRSQLFAPVSRMWHSSTLAPDGFVYVIGGCRNNVLVHTERIQTIVERIRVQPSPLSRMCLWEVVKSMPVLVGTNVPDNLLDDLVKLAL